jgi:rSAM/selenodomain-associated transferase 1
MEVAQLAVFLRPPTERSVKTRLRPLLGAEGAAMLYEAFLEDTMQLCARVREAGRISIALWVDGDEDFRVSRWSEALEAEVQRQPAGDLGVRLDAAFARGLEDHERVVVIGSDIPTLPLVRIVEAFNGLAHDEIVVGPSNDGGYYAIGAAHPVRPRFDRVAWSTPSALADTLRANEAYRVSLLSPWYDVDEESDLAVLRAHLSMTPEAAPATSKALARIDHK